MLKDIYNALNDHPNANLIKASVCGFALALTAAIAGNIAGKQEQFEHNVQLAFVYPTAEQIKHVSKHYQMPEIKFVPECNKQLGYDQPTKIIKDRFDLSAATACLKEQALKAKNHPRRDI